MGAEVVGVELGCGGEFSGRDEERGEEERADAVEREGFQGPAEEIEGGSGERGIPERGAEGELEEGRRGWSSSEDAAEGAFEGGAAVGESGCDDGDALRGVQGEAVAGPCGGGTEFGGVVRCWVESCGEGRGCAAEVFDGVPGRVSWTRRGGLWLVETGRSRPRLGPRLVGGERRG